MEFFLVIIAFLFMLIGLLGAVVPVLPGPALSYIGLLFIQWSGFGEFSVLFLVVWACITVSITVLDYVLPPIMTKRFGGSRAASIGSFLGIILGLFIIPPWGIILGPFAGAFIGELIHNNANSLKALKVALGSFLAFIIGTGAKLVIGVMIIYYAIKALF